jgi:hypothetical protein
VPESPGWVFRRSPCSAYTFLIFCYGKPLLLELAQDLGIDRIHGLLGQPTAEAGEGRMVRGRLAEGKPQKGFEGQAVGDLVFQLGIRGDAEPLLQQQAFEQHQGRVGAGAFLAGAHGVMAEQDGFHARPVDGVVELLHELDAAVLFQAAMARSAKSRLRGVFLNPIFIS